VTYITKLYSLTSHDALLITDIQIDFLPGGALPVEGGDKIIAVIQEYIKNFENSKAHILASRDWHPTNHISFIRQGGPWPVHCVQNTKGAEFSPYIKLPSNTIIISKATDSQHEAYSAFDGTPLEKKLRQLSITRLFVCGLATDYCIVNTVLDSLEHGIQTVVLMDAILGINVRVGDVDRAVETMINSGAEKATFADFA
jgi:nicotinamidase/pyrazinamidase